MTKFQKIQRWSSVIPVYSSFAVFFITMFHLKKHKATWKHWLLFSLICTLAVFVAHFVDSVIMTGLHPTLDLLAVGCVMAIANILCVELQISCERNEKELNIHK